MSTKKLENLTQRSLRAAKWACYMADKKENLTAIKAMVLSTKLRSLFYEKVSS